MNRFCRTCMNESLSHTPIYEEIIHDDSVLFEVINDMCQLEVTMTDELPKYVCSDCSFKLAEFKRFKMRSHEVRASLQRLKGNMLNLDLDTPSGSSLDENSDPIEVKVESEDPNKDVSNGTDIEAIDEYIGAESDDVKVEQEDLYEYESNELENESFEEYIELEADAAYPDGGGVACLPTNLGVADSNPTLGMDLNINVLKVETEDAISPNPLECRSSWANAKGTLEMSRLQSDGLRVAIVPLEVPLAESISLCESQLLAKETIWTRKRRRKDCSTPEKESSLSPQFLVNGHPRITDAVTESYSVDDISHSDIILDATTSRIQHIEENVSSSRFPCRCGRNVIQPVPAIPVQLPEQQITPPPTVHHPLHNNLDRTVAKLIDDIRQAKNDQERRKTCLRYAAMFDKERDDQIPVYPGYPVMIGKSARDVALKRCNGCPGKLQRLLLVAIKGKEYIGKHSALGQRQNGIGLPAADPALLQSVEMFVNSKFKNSGKAIPPINETYNRQAGNIRKENKAKIGIYAKYPKRPKHKRAGVNKENAAHKAG